VLIYRVNETNFANANRFFLGLTAVLSHFSIGKNAMEGRIFEEKKIQMSISDGYLGGASAAGHNIVGPA
jgi:hypothetical protein